MPAVSLSVLNTLSSTIAPANTPVSHDKDGFQSLLDINVPVSRDVGDRNKEDTKDVPAAAVNADADVRHVPAETEREKPVAASSDRATAIDRPVIPRPENKEIPIRPRPEDKIHQEKKDAPEEASVKGTPIDFPVLPPKQEDAVLEPDAVLLDSDTVSAAPGITLLPGITEVFAALKDTLALLPAPEIIPAAIQKTAASVTLEPAIPVVGAGLVEPPITASAVGRQIPLKDFLFSLDRLIEGIDKFLLSGSLGGQPALTAASEKPASLSGQFRAILDALQTMYKEVAGGSLSIADAQKKLRPIVADLHRLLSQFDQTPKPLDIKPIPVDTRAELLPAHPARNFLIERAESVPNMPQVQVTGTTHQAVSITALSAANINSNAGHSGTHSDANPNMPQPMAAARATGSPSETPEIGAANFTRALTHASRQQPVAEQVVFHIKTALSDGSSKIRIQLEPAELGKLDIKMQVDAAGKTGVTITADNRNTLDLLQRDVRGLERALADAGLTTDSGNLNFNLKGGDRQGQDSSQASGIYQKIMPKPEEAAADVLTRSYVVNLAEGLDIRI